MYYLLAVAAIFTISCNNATKKCNGKMPNATCKLSAQVETEQIPVLAWFGVQEHTVERYLELKEAGMTHNLTFFSSADALSAAMDAAHTAGIKMIIHCPELGKEPEQTVARFKNHPAIAGYFLRDEPQSPQFAEIGRWAKRIQAVDNQHFCYSNILPNASFVHDITYETYREHVQKFIQEIPVQFLTFDHYPIKLDASGERVLSGLWYENLEIISDEARKAGKKFWAFSLASEHMSYPKPTLADIRLQVYSNLAYGAQGIQYFTYWAPSNTQGWDYHHAPIDLKTGKRMDVYDLVKQMNSEIKNLSPVFMNAKVVSIGHTGVTIPQGTNRLGKLPDAIKTLEVEGDAVVSVLEKGNDSFLVIVNKDFKKMLAVNIEGSPDLQRVLKDGTKTPANKYINRLTVEPGDVLIFNWKK